MTNVEAIGPVSASPRFPVRWPAASLPLVNPPFGPDGLPSEPEGQAPLKDVARQVGPALPAQWTLGKNPRIGHGPHRRGYRLPASFATDCEVTEPGIRDLEHTSSIGENKANICTGPGGQELSGTKVSSTFVRALILRDLLISHVQGPEGSWAVVLDTAAYLLSGTALA